MNYFEQLLRSLRRIRVLDLVFMKTGGGRPRHEGESWGEAVTTSLGTRPAGLSLRQNGQQALRTHDISVCYLILKLWQLKVRYHQLYLPASSLVGQEFLNLKPDVSGLPSLEKQVVLQIFLHPCVFKGLPGCQSILRVDLKQSQQEVAALFGEVFGERERSELIFLAGLGKGRLYCQQFVHQNAYTPAVDFVVVVILLSNFWRDVVESAAQGASLAVGLDGPAEVSDLNVIVEAYHILWLQVPMDDPVPVQVVQPLQDLADVFGGFFL